MNRKIKKQILSELGFTLVEVMIAVAILGTLSLAVMKLTDQMTKGEKKLTQRYAANDVRTIALYALKSLPACQLTFNNVVVPDLAGYQAFPIIYQTINGVESPVIDTTKEYPDPTKIFGLGTRGEIKVLDMRIGGIAVRSAGVNTATVRITAQVSNTAQPLIPPITSGPGKNTMDISFPLRVVLDPATFAITACYEDKNAFVEGACTSLWGQIQDDGSCQFLNINGDAIQNPLDPAIKMLKVNGVSQFAADANNALMISNAAGGNILNISGNNTVDLTYPSIRSNGVDLVLNPSSSGGLFLNHDAAATSNTYINGTANGRVRIGSVVAPTSLLSLTVGANDGLTLTGVVDAGSGLVNGVVQNAADNASMAVGTTSNHPLTVKTSNTTRGTFDISGNFTLATAGANIYLNNPLYVNNAADDNKAATVNYVRQQIARTLAPSAATTTALMNDILTAAGSTNMGVGYICNATRVNGVTGLWSGNICSFTTCGGTALTRCPSTFYATNLDVSGTLTVGGATTLGSTLTVAGATTLNNTLQVNSTISATGTVNSNVGVCVGGICASTFDRRDCGVGWAVRGINRGGVFCTRTYP